MFFLSSRKFPVRFASLKAVVLVPSFFALMFFPDVSAARKSSSHTGRHSGTHSHHTRPARHYYRNSLGIMVHYPVRIRSAKVPPGAVARCRDGSYSFSWSRKGTCSRRGGVTDWR